MEYEKCLVQVYEILNHLEDEEIEKIPERIIKNIEEKMDKSYIWQYDETKSLEQQEIDRKATAILSYINMEYLLNDEERDVIEQLHKVNEEKLFPKVGNVEFTKPVDYSLVEENNEEKEVALVQISENKWYKKMWTFFRNIFSKYRKGKIIG